MLAAALALRLALAWAVNGRHPLPTPDAAGLDAVAWNLARGAGFSLDGAAGPFPAASVPPVLPWATSFLYRLVGHDYLAAVLFGCLLGALVPLLLAALAARTFGGPAGRLAGWLAVLHPPLVASCAAPRTETAFAVTLLLALLLSAEWVKTPRSGRAFGTGIAWGLASLTRPAALLLPVLVAAWAWVPLGLSLPARGRLRQAVLLLLGLALAVGPWTLRNALVLHAPVPVTAGAGLGLLIGDDPPLRAPGATGPWLLASALAIPLALWGLWNALRGPRRWFQSLGLWVVVYFAGLGLAAGGSAATRPAAEPLVLLFAAAGLDDLWRRARLRRSGLRVVSRGGG
jgi:4-amino-4-deoxy-L-arabinose transferase-like glycosyltransferase